MEGIKIAVDTGIAILSLLVQVIIYPAFYYIKKDKFQDWHAQYTGRITLFVAPLMLLQLIFSVLYLLEGEPFSIVIFLLVGFAWINTFLQAMPQHYKIHSSDDHDNIRRLIRLNMIRTACWTAIVILDIIAFTS